MAVNLVAAGLVKSLMNPPNNPIIYVEQLPEQQPLDIVLWLQEKYPLVGIEVKLVYNSKRKVVRMNKKAINKKKYFCRKNNIKGWTIAITNNSYNLWDLWAKKGFKNFPLDCMQPLNKFLHDWAEDNMLIGGYEWIDIMYFG